MGREGDGVSINLSRVQSNEESEKRLHIHFSLSSFVTTTKRYARAVALLDGVHNLRPSIAIAFILPIMTTAVRQATSIRFFRNCLVTAPQSVAAGEDRDHRRIDS